MLIYGIFYLESPQKSPQFPRPRTATIQRDWARREPIGRASGLLRSLLRQSLQYNLVLRNKHDTIDS